MPFPLFSWRALRASVGSTDVTNLKCATGPAEMRAAYHVQQAEQGNSFRCRSERTTNARGRNTAARVQSNATCNELLPLSG